MQITLNRIYYICMEFLYMYFGVTIYLIVGKELNNMDILQLRISIISSGGLVQPD